MVVLGPARPWKTSRCSSKIMSRVKIETTPSAIIEGRRYTSAKAAATRWATFALRRCLRRRQKDPENKPTKSYPATDLYAKDPIEYQKQIDEFRRSWYAWNREELLWERRTKQRLYRRAKAVFLRYLTKP